ncbi:MAG: hypothetical protein ACK5MY_16385 [Jhaorihella sp.]
MVRFLPLTCAAMMFAVFALPGADPADAQQFPTEAGTEQLDPFAGAGEPGAPGTSMHVGERSAPLDVAVGIEINQITAVDQKSENFGAVAVIRMKWHDPALAYEDTTGRGFRLFVPSDLVAHGNRISAVIPIFVVENQQSRRFIHQNMVAVMPDGTAHYFEKSSLTLQAPHFDFTRFPFDRQMFYFEIVSALPEGVVRFTAMNDQSGLGDMLGEEEWILNNAVLEISSTEGLTGLQSAKAALAFEGTRHIKYYVTRIFIPLLVLIAVSWSVFFLDDYRKRSEIAGANLLVFVGFNWVISDSLPKLGYLTFLDFILQWIFVVTGAIIVFNVILSRLQTTGRDSLARSLDTYAIKWVYPLGYAAVVAFAVALFLMPL